MKPERLEMVGFAPFRTSTRVDFSDLELFALTGPTGAGKSSVIDAITFALYGSVARHGKGSVEPVISLGTAESRIRFDFTVEGRPYTAVRVVRRTSRGGATTAEARLESQGEVLASGAAEVTSAVERLLGLTITHFTRSVVLPQGEFAAFLHDTPAGQQDLVKALLDLGVLDQVRMLANERGRTSSALAESARTRLDGLADATEEAEKAAATRLDMLEGLVGSVAAAEAAIAETGQAARIKTEEAARRRADLEVVAEVKAPPGIEALAEALAEAKTGAEVAAKRMGEARAEFEKAQTESERLPSRDRLQAVVDLDANLAATRIRLAAVDLAALKARVDDARKLVEASSAARVEAVARLEAARSEHAAHALAAGLGVGDPCPVCHRPLETEPDDAPADLHAATLGFDESEIHVADSNRLLTEAQGVLTRAQATQEAEQRNLETLEKQRGEMPAAEELEALLSARLAIDELLAAARQAEDSARAAAAVASTEVARLEGDEQSAWETFRARRDQAARLAPPPASGSDLSTAWSRLVDWAGDEAERQREVLGALVAEAEEAMAARSAAEDQVNETLAAAGVGGEGSPTARLAGAVATARADHAKAQERRVEREAVESDLAEFEDAAGLARRLAVHMRANNFEGWLLAEALASLVSGANGLLADLSRGAYSLILQRGKIEVVDHRNADEHRSVRSLSGGETFLVSLALALSLGEQLVNLSERGGARLDAIFLDEGFGSLDAETLDTVTAVVTELASQGRVVGLVTHVRELGDQVPVRFVVRPGPGGSTIERVDGSR